MTLPLFSLSPEHTLNPKSFFKTSLARAQPTGEAALPGSLVLIYDLLPNTLIVPWSVPCLVARIPCVCVCGSCSRAVYQFSKSVQRANSIVRAVPQWACQCKCSQYIVSAIVFHFGSASCRQQLADISASATILLLLHLTENI